MLPISGFAPDAAQPPISIIGAKELPKIERSEDDGQSRSIKPVTDEYVPEEKQEPIGRYWLGKDEDGQPKIYFDDPEQNKDAKGSDKKVSGEKADSCTCSTDKVDREIENLKKRQQELGRQINSETDNKKIEELRKELAQVERELSQKGNNTYRRQHATFS